jgi:hypothetical protein
MAWLRRDRGPGALPLAEGRPDLGPEALRMELTALVRFVNARSGQLSPAAVVTAREITDVLGELVGAEDKRLDTYTSVAVTGLLTDHVPTTLKTFLTVGDTGARPAASLLDQLESLLGEAVSLRGAERTKAADALLTQEKFLRTKFSNSDLDL